ncbi:MAG: ATP-dependent RNA helicase HrpA [Propionibacteriaceae bacterium]|nr:ATP-dependent RNA helicase HrpA [Propionibacteriaceae bacterium]
MFVRVSSDESGIGNTGPDRHTIDEVLPIAAHAQEIEDLVRAHQVVVVAGETGSGKTTQLPKICFNAGRQRIGHTQPRRVAARSVATRIAEEIGSPLGEIVGYQVRFTAATSQATRLKVMTDGILLAEIAHDRMLRAYDTIIIDEAHERSLNIDFLLGYLKQLLPKRPDLKVVITSATIDTARFSSHFDDAPIVEVSGRTYPVEVRYAPLDEDDDPIQAIVEAVSSLPTTGDILVFCSGEREIRDAAQAITAAHPRMDVLPLYARLTLEEQSRVFASHPGQRVVLATNVAETSLTVPGIRYVVDPGFARISRYSARTKVQRLPIEPVSQASANQRAGRCGRVAPGVCVRLYSEEDYLSRPLYTEPEILRTNLASVILAMAHARLGDIEEFPFVEAPDRTHITDGLRLLTELGAITGEGPRPHLTQTGRRLAGVPVDPRLGRMLLEGSRLGCLRETLVIVAGLSVQDVRERPQDHRPQADASHARFASDAVLDFLRPSSSDPASGDPAQTRYDGTGTGTGTHVDAARSSTSGSRISAAQSSTSGTRIGFADMPTPTKGKKRAQGAGARGQDRGHDSGRDKGRDRSHDRGRVVGGPSNREPGPDHGASAGGDFAAMLRLWAYLQAKQKALSSSQFRKLCHAEYFNYMRVREWQDLVGQLRQVSKQMGLSTNSSTADMESVVTACLSGLLSNVGALILQPKSPESPRQRRGPREYQGTRGARFAISPGSVMAKQTPAFVMAVELVETTRLWASTVAPVTPAQVEQAGAHMLTRTYAEPYFSASTGTVMVVEKTSLLGVPLVADRRVGYASIDPDETRRIFIQSGLVERQCVPRPGTPYATVLAHNLATAEQIEELEDKARRRDLFVDDETVYDFFDLRIPAGVVSLAGLDAWLRADRAHVDSLMMTMDDLVGRETDVTLQDFPDHWSFGPVSLGLDYRFTPGHDLDGVTVDVPLASLASLDPAPFTWGVPGTRHTLATAWIRTLPKAVRTRFVPAPDWATRALDWLEQHDGDHSTPFVDELSRALQALSGEPVTGWNADALPDHLKMGFHVRDEKTTTFGRDLEALQADLGRQVRQRLATASPRTPASGTTWVFGAIPTSLSIRDHGLTVTGYPGLRDDVTTVSETLSTSEAMGRVSHLQGLARLVGFALPEPYKWIVAHLSNADKLALGTSPYASVPLLLADARIAALRDLVGRQDPWAVRDEAGFDALVQAVRPEQVDATHAIVAVAAESLAVHAQARAAMGALVPGGDTAADLVNQVDNLIFDGFLHVIPRRWLVRVPVWLRGVEARARSAADDPGRDDARMVQLDPVLDAYADLQDAHPQSTPEIDHIGYLIEEFRLQIFAQSLRTVETVSSKRILKAIADAR